VTQYQIKDPLAELAFWCLPDPNPQKPRENTDAESDERRFDWIALEKVKPGVPYHANGYGLFRASCRRPEMKT
jgi:hypothetical protein